MVSLHMELTVLGNSHFWLQSKTLILPKHSCTRTCWKRRSKAGSYASNTGATAVESQHWGEVPWKICTTSEPFQCIAGTHPKWSRPRSAILLLPAAVLEDSPRPLPHFKRAVLRKWRDDCVCVCVCGTSHLVPVQCQLQVHYLRAASTLYDGKVRHHLHQHPQSYGFPQAIRSVKIRTIQWLQMNGVQSFCIVSFIDEGDDLAIWVLDFFQHSFQSFFEFTSGSAAVWCRLGWFLVIHMSSTSSHVYIDLPQGPRNFVPATMPPMSREITSKKHQGLAQGLKYKNKRIWQTLIVFF